MLPAQQISCAAPPADRIDIEGRETGRRDASAALLAAAVLAFTGSSDVARAQVVRLVVVDVKAVEKAVQNDKDERIGTFDDLVITNDSKPFAILQVGSFLGLGGHLIAIPYDSLDISDDGRKIMLAGASKEAVRQLPEYKK
jgi:hypothetical protein